MYIAQVLSYALGELPLPLMLPLQSLQEDVSFTFDERVNLFIGPNAAGKSTILRVIESISSEEFEQDRLNDDLLLSGFFVDLGDIPDDWPIDSDNGFLTSDELVTIAGTVPVLYIPATRVNLPAQGTLPDYGADDPLKALFDNNSHIFYGPLVQSAIDWLRWRRYRGLRRALEVGYSCVKSICYEVIHDDIPHPYSDVSGTERVVHYGMGIGTTDNIDDILDEPLYAGVLSSGTQGTLLWIYALVLKMASHYDWQEGWEEKPAILLIDEIENHLHPTWQRRVIPALLEHFPKLQIFATTHSPFVVAGLKAGQVHLLDRDANGVVTHTTNERDVIGWTADEILRTMMGVDEPTDQLTVDRAKRLRQLREKETLTPAEDSELNGLRRQVNEDLLSKGGPLEGQLERYAEWIQALLRSRESDLTQDGN